MNSSGPCAKSLMARALQGPPFPPCLPSFSPPTAAVPKSARPIPSPELPRCRVLLHARTTPLIYLFIPVPLSLFQLLSLSRSLARSLARSFTLAHTHTLTPRRHPLRQHPTPARGQLWRSSSWPQFYPPSFHRTGWGGSIWWGLAS